MNATGRERQSNTELFRIVAMLMIIGHHFVKHGHYDKIAGAWLPNRLWLHFLWLLGKIGVDMFIFITGYYMTGGGQAEGQAMDRAFVSKRITKVLRIALQAATYSMLSYIVFCATGMIRFSIFEAIMQALPIAFNHWWYVTTYVMLIIISPCLNHLIHNTSQSTYLKFLLLLGFIWTGIPLILDTHYQCANLVWMSYVYAVAGYIRIWGHSRRSVWQYLGLAATCVFIMLVLTIIIENLSATHSFFKAHIHHFDNMRQFPVLLTAVCLFMAFQKMAIPTNRFINSTGALTFGIYLFHEENYVRKFLWLRLFRRTGLLGRKIMIPYSIAVILAVFAAGAILEGLRIRFLERYYARPLERLADHLAGIWVSDRVKGIAKWI